MMNEHQLSEKTALELGLEKPVMTISMSSLHTDIVLDASISPKPNTPSPTTFNSILITGASGFLGAHIAYELLTTTTATLYCITRAQNTEHASQKLQLSLESYGLWSDEFSPRLIPILGDIGKQKLGLSDAKFQELSQTIDHIYHCGAFVNFLLPYYLLKNANVSGLKHILELCCFEKNIPITYLSTYSVLFSENNTPKLTEVPLKNDGNTLQLGYSQSKWVAEKIVEIAQSRNIPITTYRLGSITGDNETGLFNRKDFLTNFVDFCLKIQRIPDLSALIDMTPVNYAAKAIVELSKLPQKQSIYHVLNPNPITWATMTKALQKIMPKLKVVSEQEWRNIAIKNTHIDHPFKSYIPMLKQSQFTLSDICLKETQRCDTTNTTKALPHMFCPSINKDLMLTYLKGIAYTPPKKQLYATPSLNTTATLASLITDKQPIFLQSFMHKPTAKAAELLCQFFNTLTQQDTLYKTFFANSQLEAFDGMIKLLRHNGNLAKKGTYFCIAVFDPDCALKHKLAPYLGNDNELRPNIQWISQKKGIENAIKDPTTYALVVVISPVLTEYEYKDYAKKAAEYHTKFIVDISRTDLNFIPKLPSSCDGIIFGSNMTHYQIPSGGFSVPTKLHNVWNTFDNCLLHTSTFGGNTFTTTLICETLFNALNIPQTDRHIASLTEKQVIKLYKNYINPKLVLLLQSMGMTKSITYAYQSTIKWHDKGKLHTIIDALGSFASSLRGHNPSDIPTLLRQFNPQTNYWKKLKETLLNLSGFDDAIPAISGASAVEIAITLALMAQPQKPTILTFKHGFSGKTLVSLLGTAKEKYLAPFRPLYPQTVSIDPHCADAVEKFKEAIENNPVGLVWLEVIQGEAGVKPIPQPLLDAIQADQTQKGYLIGVDEIQTGLFRTGKFLNHEGKLRPDLVTIGKGLSDMACPIAAVLCKDSLLIAAETTNQTYISGIKEFYANHIASAISNHALTQASQHHLEQRATLLGKKIIAALKPLEEKSLIKEVRGEGLLIGIELKKSVLFSLPFIKDYVAAIFAGCCLKQQHPVLVAFTLNNPTTVRLAPSLTISEQEIETIITTIQKVANYSSLKLLLKSMS